MEVSRGADSSRPKSPLALMEMQSRGSRRTLAAFLVVILALPIVSLWSTYEIGRQSAQIVAVEELRLDVNHAMRFALDEETGVRGYALTREPLFLGPYAKAKPNLDDLLHALPGRFTSTGLSVAMPELRDFIRLHAMWNDTIAAPLIAKPQPSTMLAIEKNGKVLMDKMRADVVAIHQKAVAVAAGAATRMYWVTALAAVIDVGWILFIGAFAFVLERRARRRETDLLLSVVHEREEVQKLSEWRSELLAMLAHDFKSQLTVLIGAAHMLEDFPERRGDPALLGAIRGAGYTLAEMADNAILLARAQERGFALQRSPVDVVDVANDVAERYGEERVIVVNDIAVHTTIEADRTYVMRAFDNVLANAVKYSDDPIGVEIADGHGCVTVTVVDTGTGISAEDLPHVFDEFWRSERTSGKRKGSGVGLFIVKAIVEAHGGSVEVRSTLGEGTSVSMRFPRAADAPAPEPVRAGVEVPAGVEAPSIPAL